MNFPLKVFFELLAINPNNNPIYGEKSMRIGYVGGTEGICKGLNFNFSSGYKVDMVDGTCIYVGGYAIKVEISGGKWIIVERRGLGLGVR